MRKKRGESCIFRLHFSVVLPVVVNGLHDTLLYSDQRQVRSGRVESVG